MYESTQSEVQQIALSQQPVFEMRWEGDPEPGERFTLASMLEANREDEDLKLWLRSAVVGGGRIFGGGAVKACYIKRVL